MPACRCGPIVAPMVMFGAVVDGVYKTNEVLRQRNNGGLELKCSYLHVLIISYYHDGLRALVQGYRYDNEMVPMNDFKYFIMLHRCYYSR